MDCMESAERPRVRMTMRVARLDEVDGLNGLVN